jgi:hypothetical protein
MNKMSVPRTLLIIDKSGSPKILSVKDYKEEELYKKCGFKKPDGLEKRHIWTIRLDKIHYRIALFAKEEGNDDAYSDEDSDEEDEVDEPDNALEDILELDEDIGSELSEESYTYN